MYYKTGVFLSVGVAFAGAQSINVSGASSDCNAALNTLNSDSSLSTCTKNLVAAGSSFNATTASASTAESSLSSFCSATVSCSEDSVRSALSALYSKCGPELAGGSNKEVTLIYDVVYTLLPYRTALCSKGDDGKLCAISGSSSVSIPTVDGKSMPSQEVLQSIGTNTPNGDIFAQTNMLFLFLNPSTPTDTLCSTCSRNIMGAYMDFETSTDYAPGLPNSILLKNQKALYTAIKNNCPSGTLQAAGSLSGGFNSNAAAPRGVLSTGAAVTVLFSAVALAAF